MGYDYSVTDYYTIKHKKKDYPWPVRDSSAPERTITLFDDDILTKSDDGTFFKQTGLGCGNITVPEEDLVFHEGKKVNLRLN